MVCPKRPPHTTTTTTTNNTAMLVPLMDGTTSVDALPPLVCKMVQKAVVAGVCHGPLSNMPEADCEAVISKVWDALAAILCHQKPPEPPHTTTTTTNTTIAMVVPPTD